MVKRLGGKFAWPVDVTVGAGSLRLLPIDAVGVLRETVKAGAIGPRAGMAVRRERHNDKAGAFRDKRVFGEAPRGETTGAIALHKNIGVADECVQGLFVGRGVEIERGRTFAATGVDHQLTNRRQPRAADVEHIGTMGGERASGHWPSDNARQIEDADARERTRGERQGFAGRVADAGHFQERQPSDGLALGVRGPLSRRPRHGCDEFGGGGCVLELSRVPLEQPRLHRLARIGAAEQCQETVAVMGEVGVDAHPALISRPIEPSDRVPHLRRCA